MILWNILKLIIIHVIAFLVGVAALYGISTLYADGTIPFWWGYVVGIPLIILGQLVFWKTVSLD